MKRLIILVFIVIFAGIIIRNTDVFDNTPTDLQTPLEIETPEDTTDTTDTQDDETPENNPHEIETETSTESNETLLSFENKTSNTAPLEEEKMKNLTETPSVVKIQQPKEHEPTQETPLIPQQTVKIYMYEWDIDIMKSNLMSGVTQFEVINNGNLSHNFGIIGGKDFGKVKPNEKRVFIADLPQGEVTFYSSKRVDQERGMMKTILAQ